MIYNLLDSIEKRSMSITFIKFLFLLLILGFVNIAYKGKAFNNKSWGKIVLLSLMFTLSSLVLLINKDQKILITLNIATIGFFSVTTLLWFVFPKIIRFFGKYPNWYLKDKKNNTRFIVRFELPSMTVKYFEVLFQQSTFLYLLYAVLINTTKINTIFLFAIIIVFIHLGNLFFMEKKWALFYTVLSFPMALIFGQIILQGLALITASFHLLFYLIFNSSYWFKSN